MFEEKFKDKCFAVRSFGTYVRVASKYLESSLLAIFLV